MPLEKKVRLSDLHAARESGKAMAMLTCYDFTTASVMQSLGVPILLTGDTAASVILGHESTTAATLDFLIELTAAVRRGAPNAFVMGDMPFGSYHGDEGVAVDNVCRMVRETGCDAVKLEVADRHTSLVSKLSDAGVAVCAHLALRPQSVQLYGYRAQARTPETAAKLVESAKRFEDAGAAMILLEAVPAESGKRVADAVNVPVIGCGAGPAPMAHVVVLQDLLGLTGKRPRFVPVLPEASLRETIAAYADAVESGAYPAAEHCYQME